MNADQELMWEILKTKNLNADRDMQMKFVEVKDDMTQYLFELRKQMQFHSEWLQQLKDTK